MLKACGYLSDFSRVGLLIICLAGLQVSTAVYSQDKGKRDLERENDTGGSENPVRGLPTKKASKIDDDPNPNNSKKADADGGEAETKRFKKAKKEQ